MFVQLGNGSLIDIEEIKALLLITETIDFMGDPLNHGSITRKTWRVWASTIVHDISEDDAARIREAIDKTKGIL